MGIYLRGFRTSATWLARAGLACNRREIGICPMLCVDFFGPAYAGFAYVKVDLKVPFKYVGDVGFLDVRVPRAVSGLDAAPRS